MSVTSYPLTPVVSVNGLVLTADRAVETDGAGSLEASSVTSTELGYLSGVTSAIQTQLNGKEPTLTKGNLTESTSSVLTITGGTNAVIGSGTTIQVAAASGSTSGYLSSTDWNTFNGKEPAITTLPISKGGTNSGTALNNNRIIISSGSAIVEASAITASRALVSNGSGIPEAATTTATEIGYVNGCGAKLVGKLVKTYFRPDIGNWNSMAFPMFMPSLTDAVTISSVKVTVDGTGTTPTLKWNIEIRPASAQFSAGTDVWATDKETAEATALTEYNTFTNASLSASDVLWFATPSSGAVVSGTSITYICIHVEYART